MKRHYFIITSILILLPLLAFAAKIDYPITGNETGLVAIIKNIYTFVLGIVGIAAFTMIVWGGMLYFFSAGNASKASEGKGKITNAILGLLIIAGSYLILYTINPDFVKLTEPTLPDVITEKFEDGQVYENSWACIEDGKTISCANTKDACEQGSSPQNISCKNPCTFQPTCVIGQKNWNACQPVTLIFDPSEIKTSEYATMKATFKSETANACDGASATFSIRLTACLPGTDFCATKNYNYVNSTIECGDGENCAATGLLEIYKAGTYAASVIAKNGTSQSPAFESTNELTVKGEDMLACRQPLSSKEKEAGLSEKILECYVNESDCKTECPTLGKGAICVDDQKISMCEPTLCKIRSISIKNNEPKCTISQVIKNSQVITVAVDGDQCTYNWNAELQIFKGDLDPNQSGPPKYSKYGSPINQTFKNNRASFQIGPFVDIGQYYIQVKAFKTENSINKFYDLLDYYNKPIIVIGSSTCADAME